MTASKFYALIKNAQEESAVDHAFRTGFNIYYPGVDIKRPYQCDGYIKTTNKVNNDTRVLIEYKHDIQMKNRVALAKVILQVIFYLKRFEEAGEKRPNIYVIGDKNEALVSHTNELKKYLDEEINWSASPSTAWQYYPELLLKIANDSDINPFIYDIDENFSFKVIVDNINALATGVTFKTHINKHNLRPIFDYFVTNVVKSKNIQSHQLAETIIGCILDKNNYYVHPNKNVIVTPNKNVKEVLIDKKRFETMFSQFDDRLTLSEEKVLRGCADELIEDAERRFTGDFWTPVVFADKAQEMLCEELGDDYRKEYTVWDCCCGGKNLTRDYYFNNLYCSTLLQSEIGISNKYNKEATTFQFDFLNDDLTKLPQNLLEDLRQNKKFVFLINPPYGTNGNLKQDGTTKKGIANTMMGTEMKKNGIDGSENLQHQFLYRINQIKSIFNLTDVTVAVFSNPIWLTGQRQKRFLTDWCSNFEFKKGIMFQASAFAGVSGAWGITFNIWRGPGQTLDVHNFKHTLIGLDKNDDLYELGENTLYNAWGSEPANKWVRKEVKLQKTIVEAPKLYNALKVGDTLSIPVCTYNGQLGYFQNGRNLVQGNDKRVNIYSASFRSGEGLPIFPSNFEKCSVLWAARKLVTANWVNDKDEYFAPDQTHPAYEQFVKDSVVLSLFSKQSSLRDVDYHEKKWDIKNEWFWMSREDIAKLADECTNYDVIDDLNRTSEQGERYVYEWLKENRQYLSDDVRELLQMLDEAVKKTFSARQLFCEEHPEYQINNWDCGWYQIKGMLKEYFKTDLDAIKAQYKNVTSRMEPLVYELGFLKK